MLAMFTPAGLLVTLCDIRAWLNHHIRLPPVRR